MAHPNTPEIDRPVSRFSDDDVRSSAEEFAAQLRQQYSTQFLHALMRALRETLPKRRGRLPGTGEDDRARLHHMAELLTGGQATSLREAARLVAAESPGHSERATARRIRRKYAEDEKAHQDAVERAKLVGSLFDKDLEPWNL